MTINATELGNGADLAQGGKSAGPKLPSHERVARIITEVVHGGERSREIKTSDLKLYAQLVSLARYIQNAKHDLASVRPTTLKREEIPNATDQLDATVQSLERTTNMVIDGCNALSALAPEIPESVAAKMQGIMGGIYEACTSQEVDTQRINKVVKILKHIEERVEGLLEIFGGELEGMSEMATESTPAEIGSPQVDPDQHLMEGPQLPSDAISQDEIDKLLASFN
ncbi:MAG: chemotaxis protein CheZ [Alphaproteobacteria bacterium]|nr:MAG: chemotaxis protein CheZ [Alphaproteobacteria bacterium]